MAYISHLNTTFAAFGASVYSCVAALCAVSERIVDERRRVVAGLAEKSDEDLARIGLRRDQIAQDVHRHLYYS
ncbi:MAG: hypothetical protein AAFQ05_03495 [Pseudomonadota bacterium]